MNANFWIISNNTNADSNHTTEVYVGTSTGQTVTSNAAGTDGPTGRPGDVGSALVTGSSSYTAVPVSVTASAWDRSAGSASVSVTTAEAAAVNDTTKYAPLGLGYNISNVGYAATGGVSPTPTGNLRRPAVGADRGRLRSSPINGVPL